MASGTNIGSLFWSTGIDSTGLRRDSKKASSALTGLFNPAILGATALAGAILKAGDAALSFSRDFETAFAEVQTISQTARENADAMRDSLLELTTKIPVQAVDATKALYQIVSAGFDGADAMAVLEISAKAAIAGVSDTATAADTLTTIINAYGLEAGNATQISDALFKTVELGKTKLAEIGSSFSQVASIAAAYNIQLNDVLAGLAEITQQGGTTSEAITRIRSAIVALSKEFGPAVFEGRSLAEAFQFAREEADKSGKTYEEFFGRVEASVGILQLTGKNIDNYNEKLGEIKNSAGSTEAALDIMNTTLESQETLLKNNINILLEQFGGVLSDIKKEILPGLNAELQVLADKSIPGYAKALSVLANTLTGFSQVFFGTTGFSAEYFSPEIVKFQKEAERQVKAFNDRTSKLSDDEFKKEVERIKDERDENLEAFNNIQDRKEKGYQFDEEKLKEARQRNLTFYKILEEAEKRLAATRKETPEPGGVGGETTAAKPRTFQDILTDISNAEKAVKTSTISQIKDANDRVKALEKERDNWLDIANAVEVATETVSKFKKIKTGDVTAFIDPKVPEVASKETDKLGLTIDKLNKKIAVTAKRAEKMQDELSDSKSEKNIKNIITGLDAAAQTLSMITSEFGEQLGLSEEQVKLTQDFSNILSGVGDIVSGNFIQGGLKIVGSLLSQLLPEVTNLSDSFIHANEQINKIVSSIGLANDALTNLGSSGGTASLNVLYTQLVGLQEQSENLANSLENVRYGEGRGRGESDRGLSPRSSFNDLIEKAKELDEELKRLSERLISGGISDEQRKSIEAILESYLTLANEIDSIITDTIGISITDLSDSLTEAFLNGETAAESWGKTVDDIIKNVIIKQLSASLLSDQISKAVNKLVSDTAGGLTPDEAAAFQNEVERIAETTAPAFEAARKALEDIGFDFTGTDSTDTGLAGAIKREITEETAGLLLGRTIAIQVDLKEIQELNINQNEILLESSGYLQQIEINTRNNALIPEVLEELQAMNVNLKNNL